MFETAQQEPGSGSTKVVGMAVAIVAVLMVVLYFLFLRGEPTATPEGGAGAATSAATAAAEEPNPARDLVIVNFKLGRDQTQTMALWDLQLSNRSRANGYRNIQYSTNYYSDNGDLLYHNEGTLEGEMTPGDQRTIAQLNDGLYPVGTSRFTIEITNAESFRPE